jgi:hypothetical protein
MCLRCREVEQPIGPHNALHGSDPVQRVQIANALTDVSSVRGSRLIRRRGLESLHADDLQAALGRSGPDVP